MDISTLLTGLQTGHPLEALGIYTVYAYIDRFLTTPTSPQACLEWLHRGFHTPKDHDPIFAEAAILEDLIRSTWRRVGAARFATMGSGQCRAMEAFLAAASVTQPSSHMDGAKEEIVIDDAGEC